MFLNQLNQPFVFWEVLRSLEIQEAEVVSAVHNNDRGRALEYY